MNQEESLNCIDEAVSKYENIVLMRCHEHTASLNLGWGPQETIPDVKIKKGLCGNTQGQAPLRAFNDSV
jgi:hypothetical protein